MSEKSNQNRAGKDLLIMLGALSGGFLLSFLAFGLLWSGIAWHIQIIMALPFALLSYGVYCWSKGSYGFCAFIVLGASPLGVLIARFRDTNDSHLLPILIVSSWVIGILAGWYWGKLSLDSRVGLS